MTEQPPPAPQRTLNRNPILLVALIVITVAVAFFSGRSLERAQPVSPQAELQTAVQAFRLGYDQAALSMLVPLANEGNPKAQYWLADIYENGLGVKSDPAVALDLLKKSAGQGFVPAERHLGELYLRGNETMQDFGLAQTWLSKAASAGDGEAQRQLGHIFALGLGVPRDLARAYAWYENAVLSGDGLAKPMRDDLLTRMSPADIAKGEQMAKDIAGSPRP